MQNPLRSEQAAFRLVWATAGYFLLIVIAAKFGGRWAGVGVFVAETAIIATLIAIKRSRSGVAKQEPTPDGR